MPRFVAVPTYLIPEIGDVAAGSVEVLHLPGGDLVQRVQSHRLRLSAPQQSQLWSPSLRIKPLKGQCHEDPNKGTLKTKIEGSLAAYTY
jgi:hypothetical protein